MVCGAVLAIMLTLAPAYSQSRKAVHLRGNLMVGQGPSSIRTSNYLHYSTGTESIRRSTPATGSGVLGSSIYSGRSNYYRSRPAAAPHLASRSQLLGGGSPSRSRRYQSASSPGQFQMVGGSNVAAVDSMRSANFSGLEAEDSSLADALAEKRKHNDLDPDQPITSLVPDLPGPYHDLMQTGEQAFKAGKYREALVSFNEANEFAKEIPGLQLALMHTSLALAKEPTSKTTYIQPADCLARALELFPALPLWNVPPKGYYGNTEDYAKHLALLESHVQTQPKDAYAQFLLAYLKWREGKFNEAETAVQLAYEHSTSKQLTQTLDQLAAGVASTATRKITGERPTLGKPAAYPWAGIEVALPVGFTINPSGRAEQIFLATKGEAPDSSQTITMLGFPVASEMTPKAFLDQTLKNALQENPKIVDFKEVDHAKVLLKGRIGVGMVLEYTHRDVASKAVAICFIRPVKYHGKDAKSNPVRMATLIVVEVSRKQEAELLPMVDAIARSIQLTDFHRPLDLPLTNGPVLTDPQSGLEITAPAGWAAGVSEGQGLVLGQIDYGRGGVANPGVMVGSLTVSKPITAEQCVQKVVASETKKGYRVKLISQQAAKLAGLDGTQFVLQKQVVGSAAAKDTQLEGRRAAAAFIQPGPPFQEITRFLIVPGEGGKNRIVYITLISFETEGKKALGVMDTLAKNLQLLKVKTP